jgi:hypothetical protein
MYSANKRFDRPALETVHEGKNEGQIRGVLGPKLEKFKNYLNEVSDEGKNSQMKKVNSSGDNIFKVNYLRSNTLWLNTLDISSTSRPYSLQLCQIPYTIRNENKLTIYMKTTPENQLTNYINQFIINDISYSIFWEYGLFPDLRLDCNPDCTESIVKQECTFLPSFGGDRFIVTSTVTIYGI